MHGTLTKGNTVRLTRSFPALAAHRDGVGLDFVRNPHRPAPWRGMGQVKEVRV